MENSKTSGITQTKQFENKPTNQNENQSEEIILAIKNSYGIKYFSEKKFLENLKQFKKK
jgi:hypothetical protein